MGFLAVQELFQIPESLRLGEHPDKVVAAAASIGGDCHVGKASHAADDFVQGAVSSAGVNPHRLAGAGCLGGKLPALTGSLGYPDFVLQSSGFANSVDFFFILLLPVPASGGRVDDEKVGHFSLPLRVLSVYI